MNYISTTQFKAYNPEVDVTLYSNTTLSGMISRASNEIDDFLGYSLLREDITTEKLEGMVDSDNNLVIITHKRPINSISEVKIVKGTYSGTIDLTDGAGNTKYDISRKKERVVFPGADITMTTVSIIDWGALRTTNFWVTISYNAGYYGYEIPEPIQQATQLWVMDIIARKQNISGATSIRQGGIAMTFASKTGESDLIKDAKGRLRHYRRVALV